MTHSFGIEIETSGASIAAIKREFSNRGIKGCEVKPDGTPSVDAEIVLPPLADCQVAYEYLESVCAAIAATGANVNRSCGLHVHISNAPLADGSNAAAFTGDSIAHKERTGRYLSRHGEPLDAVAVKDIMLRYTAQQGTVDGMLPASRRGNRYCMALNTHAIEAANTLSELTSATHGKFSTINLTTWSRGTIEFRQHSGTIEAVKIWNWTQFILNLVRWTTAERVTSGARTIVTDTPVQPFRGGSRVGVQYAMMRALDGATTRDIMNATGCSEQRVRAAVSEIRARVGDAAVVTHTQQANGARYGDGTDLTRYEVLQTFETQSTGATLMPENRRGMESIWAGLSDDLFEYWNNRIIEFR
jgi:hypothetical protein